MNTLILQLWYYLYFLGPFLVIYINLLTGLEILRILTKKIINMKNMFYGVYKYYEYDYKNITH